MTMYSLIHADVLKWAAEYTGPQVHAILCDPPYHLTEITKRFGKENAKPAKFGKDGVFARASRGFMNAEWDGGDLCFRAETWVVITKHLLPGGFGMAFAGSKGWHRMAVAIEDAGMIIHPTMFLWGYASGFPKATRIDSQIDSAAGKIQQVIGTKQHQPKFAAADFGYREKDNGFNSTDRETFELTAPATELAAAWSGHRYGGQAIKPATEPIIVFQKPYDTVTCEQIREVTGWDHWCTVTRVEDDDTARGLARPKIAAKWGIELPAGEVYQIAKKALHAGVESCIEYWQHFDDCDTFLGFVNVKPFRAWSTDNSVACMLVTRGAGALNIDAGRIGADWDNDPNKRGLNQGFTKTGDNTDKMFMGDIARTEYDTTKGRWPANLILSHNEDCKRIGVKRVKIGQNDSKRKEGDNGWKLADGGNYQKQHYADDDGYETVDEWECTPGCAVARLGEQSGESPSGSGIKGRLPDATSVMDFQVSRQYRAEGIGGDTGTAARYFYNVDWMYERLEDADPVIYRAKASTAERDAGLDELPTITVDDGRQKPIDNPHLRGETGRKNPHPTVKAVSITKHLASLLLPPDCYSERRLLVPFAGVSSEMIGALLAGWDEVIGIELEEKHVKVGNIRLAKWTEIAERLRTAEPDVIVKELTRKGKKPAADSGQMSLFDLVAA